MVQRPSRAFASAYVCERLFVASLLLPLERRDSQFALRFTTDLRGSRFDSRRVCVAS
jgi:hypothetical protein